MNERTTQRVVLIGLAALALATLAVAVAAGSAPFAASAAVAAMVPAAVIDVEQRRLPDIWVAAALVVLIVSLAVSSAVAETVWSEDAFGGLIGGALAMMLPVLVLHLASPSSMGFGDVKAAGALGAAVGTIDWRLGVVALCLASLSGGAVGLLGRRRTIPLGPFLVLGAWASVLAHDRIIPTLAEGAMTS